MNTFSKVLQNKGHSRGAEIVSFDMKHIKMPWDLEQDDGHNDCALYVMHEMKEFRGGAYDSETLSEVCS